MQKGLFAVVFIIAGMMCSAICYADTVTMPYGSSNIITQTNPQSGGNYSRTDIVYSPGAGMAYDSVYSNGIIGSGNIDINGTEYMQITTSYGNTGMATVTVNPVNPSGTAPTDTDAYQTAYLSALQSYGLTIDPLTGQIVSVK